MANASRSTSTQVSGPDGKPTTDAQSAATLFAKSLEEVHKTHNGPEFCDTMREEVESHVKTHIGNYVPCFTTLDTISDVSDLLICPIESNEVSTALARCKHRSAPGQDGIPYSVVKRVPQCTLSALASLYTSCLASGYFPRAWKEAIGVMIPKTGKDPKVVTNYRPISLLCALGKLFEKVIVRRMQEYLREQGFFNEYQRAYLKDKEAAEHIYCLGDEIRLAKSCGWITTALSLDVEKAFDSVWHDGLRFKLSSIGLPETLVRLLSSFLTERTIRVRVDRMLSDRVYLRAGTPQGSVLSPLLYLIYVNDLPIQPANYCRAGQFADDISSWTTDHSKKVTFIRLQRTLNEIQRWCSKWRIKLNVRKTQLVCFSRKGKKMTLEMFGNTINESDAMTLLGVTFDKNGNHTAHCQSKAAKAMQRVSLLRLISGKSWGAKRRTLLHLYKQYIRPVLETGGVTTVCTTKANISRLQRVQNAALRRALRAPWQTRIEDLHAQAKIPMISDRLEELRRKAIARFGNSANVQALEFQRLRMTGH